MRLADIKKLKVVELRCRLNQLGLDSRGLKAELVERLWSSAQEEAYNRQDESKPTENKQTLLTETTDSLHTLTEAGVGTICSTDRSRQLTNAATQTDHDPGPPSVPQAPCEALPAGEEGGEPGRLQEPTVVRGRSFYEFKEEIRYKRAKSPLPVEKQESEEQDEDKVRFDTSRGHLHFEGHPDGSGGQPRFWERFPLLWSGCKLTHGVLQGHVGFEMRIERRLVRAQLKDEKASELCGVRVGWSTSDASLLLGEDELSFCFDGRGIKVCSGIKEEFGETFSEGDIIGSYASFSKDGAVELSFQKNGRDMGVGFSLDPSVLQGRALFPHVFCKSCSVRLLLDTTAPPWYPGPPGFTALAALPPEQRVHVTIAPISRAQSEVVLMVGLPGSGKTCWAKTYMKQHPEKGFRLLGTEELLACMISGGQSDCRLQQASQCLTELNKVAAETLGNYILDQCNVLFSARHHKLQLFAGFRRRVVVIFPSLHEWKRRLLQHQNSDGENIPEIALLKLQVSCSLPELQAELLEELLYVELQQEEAHVLLEELKEKARRLLPPVFKQEKKPRVYGKRPHPRGPPPTWRNQWTGSQGWKNQRINTEWWRHQPSLKYCSPIF
ncbi:heterogeneous nuclear ribonucleoprotein U-like protein 2 [Gouania willdenowi]|uniref:heterogeneous nuclear ribonucleoprotein U-like protein 2 n=1 Tax=Gouania willdenowi TaxID=441366 RepID=UPI001056BDF1|nr:heterogeneous nuclear ribonucleoprotein U-like protein 2 [Gouania willdenowi]